MSIENLSVEQFMDAIKSILHEHDVEAPDDIDDMLVSLYNSYGELLRDGKSWEESEPLLTDAVKKIVLALQLEADE